MRSSDRGGAGRALLIVVVLLLAVLVVTDRAGVAIAERVAGDTVEKSQHLSSRPAVDIAGFPFLTQLARGDFERITITAHDVPVDRTADRLDLTQLRVVLDTVTVPRDFSAVRAATATATAVVGYPELSKRLDLDVRYAGAGRISASKRLVVLGQTLNPTISAAPRLIGGAIAFAAVQVAGLGAVSGQVAPGLVGAFRLTLPLQGVPFQVTARSLTAGPAGLALVLTGRNLSYAKR